MTRAGFTLLEALIAIALVAVVLPLAVGGISAATHAATDVNRHATARRLAESKLARLVADGSWQSSAQSGDFAAADDGDDAVGFHWKLGVETWRDPTVRILTLTVAWDPASDGRQVAVATLATQSTSGTTTTSTPASGSAPAGAAP